MNIAKHVENAAKQRPDHSAIIFEDNAITYSELNRRANQVANALKTKQIDRGDRVALYLPNIPEFAICYLALMKIGAIAVSINTMFKSEEVKYIVNDSEPKIIFTVDELASNIPLLDCASV